MKPPPCSCPKQPCALGEHLLDLGRELLVHSIEQDVFGHPFARDCGCSACTHERLCRDAGFC